MCCMPLAGPMSHSFYKLIITASFYNCSSRKHPQNFIYFKKYHYMLRVRIGRQYGIFLMVMSKSGISVIRKVS